MINIVKRRVDIKFDYAEAVGWFPGEPIVERFLDTISFFFPSGEKFFIDSVMYYKEKIVNPVLKEQVRSFVYQEAMHTNVHKRCNAVLLDIYPRGWMVDRIGYFTLLGLGKLSSRSFQLAISCAIEHFTAILADSLFCYLDYILERASPDFSQLWTWHAVEETEHKSVCFDVYSEQVGVGIFAYILRIIAMVIVIVIGVPVITTGVLLMRKKKSLSKSVLPAQKAPNLKSSTVHLVHSLICWRLCIDYFKPSFHPWDHDNSEKIERWKEKFPNFGHSSSHAED